MSDTILAQRMAMMQESATLALNARAKQLTAEGRTIYNFTAGELASDTPEYIQRAVSRILKRNKYTPVAGMNDLRQIIAAESRSFYGLKWITPENVVVSGGAKPALYATFLALINPGDEVILPVPAWVSYVHLIELAGGIAVPVPLSDNFDIDAAAIKAKLSKRTKAIVVNSPHNPTGAIFSKTALKELAAVIHGTGIIVIADDIYSKLVYDDGFTPVPTVGFEHVLIINGFSKSQALTGWRIGYAIASLQIARAITQLLSHITGNAAVPSQEAAIAAMARHDRPPAETLADLSSKRQAVAAALRDIEGIRYQLPGGSFYFFIDVRQLTKDSADWCERLLNEAGVALVPGEAFLAPGYARLTFSVDQATLDQGLAALTRFIKK